MPEVKIAEELKTKDLKTFIRTHRLKSIELKEKTGVDLVYNYLTGTEKHKDAFERGFDSHEHWVVDFLLENHHMPEESIQKFLDFFDDYLPSDRYQVG